jgi:hemolysin D
MNDRPAPPQVSRTPRSAAPTVSGRDREFLPAALEILESPPPPLPVALMGTICAFAMAALAWSFFGKLDVHATAPGKIEIAGYSKVIEPLDPGKIAAIHVEQGESVREGDLLLELDTEESAADALSAQNALNASLAEVARRRYAIQAMRQAQGPLPPGIEIRKGATELPNGDDDSQRSVLLSIERLSVPSEANVPWDPQLPEPFRLREDAVLRADLTQLSDALKALDTQTAQKMATQTRLNMSMVFENKLIETLNERVSTRQEAIDLKVGTKINLYDAKQELQKSEAALASDQGQLIETEAALEQVQSEKVKAVSQFIADNENKLADASRKSDEARQALAKAAARLSRAKLYAPVNGIVQQTAVTTVGQVVTTGQQLVVITPNSGRLQVEALVANLDIGFVKLGQDAAIKVDAFPFTRFGVLRGKVTKIASGAVAEQDAKRAFANATSAANVNQSPNIAPGQPEAFVFPVTIALDETAIKVDDTTIPLTPGMTVNVEIKTDSRRVIDYLLSPLVRIASEAGRER